MEGAMKSVEQVSSDWGLGAASRKPCFLVTTGIHIPLDSCGFKGLFAIATWLASPSPPPRTVDPWTQDFFLPSFHSAD